jgi:hypothetical protein
MASPKHIFIFTTTSLLIVCTIFCTSSWLQAREPGGGKIPLQNATSGSSLTVLLEPIPYPAKVHDNSTKFKVSFLKPGTSTLQKHVDFNLRIYDNSSRVFQATNSTGQPSIPLHATDGAMSIPMLNYKFNHPGQYRIEIPVYGILFSPITPEFANFTIDAIK